MNRPEIFTLFRSGIFIIVFVFICFTRIVSQTQIIHPTTYNYFQAAQLLPDGSSRLFITSAASIHTRWNDALMIDISSSTSEPVVRNIRDSLLSWTPFYSGEKILHFPLSDGGCILGINQFDCDFGPPSEVCILNPNGNIIMMVDLDWNNQFGQIMDIGLVARDKMAIIFEGEFRYFDFQGNEIFILEEPYIYTNVIKAGDFYIGSFLHQLVLLNHDFEQIDWNFKNYPIHFLVALSNGNLINATSNEICLYTPLLNHLSCNNNLDNIITAVSIQENIWAANHEGLYKLDTTLKVLAYFPTGPGETIEYLFVKGDTLNVISSYNGINHVDEVQRTFIDENINLVNSEDIGISGFIFPDVIWEIYDEHCSFGSGLDFDFLDVMVSNYSADTINSFTINCDWPGGVMCRSFQKSWSVDTISLLPFDSVLIHINPFQAGCVNLYNGVCAWVADPNGVPDILPQNDLLCMDANIVIGTTQAQSFTSLVISPNPADNFIRIALEKNDIDDLHGVIFTSNGVQVETFTITNEETVISVANFIEGMYFINFTNDNGQHTWKKFVVIH